MIKNVKVERLDYRKDRGKYDWIRLEKTRQK